MKKNIINNFKKIVINVANLSKSKSIKVGALILKDNRIISIGYNGQLPGEPHKKVRVNGINVAHIHAEQNCIMFCAKNGIGINNCEMLITHYPCNMCSKLCIMAGIKKIYYINNYENELNVFKHKIEIIKC